ncbi:hypothetical protein DLAC_09972 [Tieghemostelium lacteum]|uniref:Kinase n=1 Tax=Tieghemostelium lacteum TaxID=361077 RepID=A0A151Z5S9_TIELA|nr:hypothetical protein DLAC_09972 [Tieghemostelium lacteum]|eukprot:KYQ89313.1 hypothetical protein DLAC_09972 [Tieghemostelium lacteum]
MIPISLSSVCEYNTPTSSTITLSNNSTSNNNNNNNNSNSSSLNNSQNSITFSPLNNQNNINSSTDNIDNFIPIQLKFRPCLLLSKEYQICNTTYTKKKDNPLSHLYDNPTTSQSPLLQSSEDNISNTISFDQLKSPSIHSSTSSLPIDNEQTSNSINFEMENENIINNSNNSNSINISQTSSSSSIHPQMLKKRSVSFSAKNLNLLSHQVAGQAPLLKLPDGKILKPLVPAEYQFYESMINHHREFKDFTPTFHGVLDLKNIDFQFLEESFKSHPLHSFDFNHWKNKIISLPKDYQNLYIKIEDLTYLCKYPCILDLKMGTRQYGSEATMEKIKKMDEKCRNTTSATMGFRVCGLKVYDQKNSVYSNFDKFFGRKLTDADVPSIICKFIDNGLRHRNEILTGISKRLYQLISLFEQQQCFKFYGSSLLLIYDGQSTNLQDAKINIKMVDFANCTPTCVDKLKQQQQLQPPQQSPIVQPQPLPTSSSSIPISPLLSSSSTSINNNTCNNKDLDEGYLFGLKNLLKIINNLIQISNTTNGDTI